MRKGKIGGSKGKLLFIDARSLGYMIDRRVRELSEEDIQKIATTYQNWRQGTGYENIIGFCKEETIEQIAGQDYILTPAQYVGIVEKEDDGEPFEEKMERLVSELSVMFDKSLVLQRDIKDQLQMIGFEV